MHTITGSFRGILDFCLNTPQIEISRYNFDHAMSFLSRILILTLKLPLLHFPSKGKLSPPSRMQFRLRSIK